MEGQEVTIPTLPGTGGRGILVRIPWTPRAARKSRTAARARRKVRYFAESADLATLGQPREQPYHKTWLIKLM